MPPHEINTAITDIEAAPAVADGVYYNILGQPVTHPTTGLYIHNGQKVLVK